MSWTSSNAFTDVSIDAWVSGTIGTEPISAYLTTAVGPGATSSTLLDSVTFTPSDGVPTSGVLLFSGLTLDAGTYYLVLAGGPKTSGFNGWEEGNLPVSTAPGVTQPFLGLANSINPGEVIDADYPPGSTWETGFLFTDAFDVAGDPVAAVPEPKTCGILSTIALVFFLRKRIRGKSLSEGNHSD